MFKSFQDTSALQQFHGFPNLNMQQATSAYGFSGVTFWLDAAYGLNTQTNLGAVSSWQQRVGGGTFVQATAGNQPRLILNDANYNNLPSVESVSTVRFMATTAGTGLRLNPQFTFAVISKINTANGVNGIMGAASNSLNLIFDGGTSANYNGFGHNESISAPVFFQGTTKNLNPRIKVITRNSIIVNGTLENTGTANPFLELTHIFRGGADTASNMVGTIAEIIAFPYTMTSDEAIALSNNINQKYAIY